MDGGETTRPIHRVKEDESKCCLIFNHHTWNRFINIETGFPKVDAPKYLYQGKAVSELIKKLRSSKNQNCAIKISVDEGDHYYTINHIEKQGRSFVLMYCRNAEDESTEADKVWSASKKNLSDLIIALQTFENQDQEVLISIDNGQTAKPVYLAEYSWVLRDGFGALVFHDFFWKDSVYHDTKLPKKAMFTTYGYCILDIVRKLQTSVEDETKIPLEKLNYPIKISADGGVHYYPITRISQRGNSCLLVHAPNMYDEITKAQQQWQMCGKKVSDLITILQLFECHELLLLISIDDGKSTYPVTRIRKEKESCCAQFCRSSWLQYIDPETKLPKNSLPDSLCRGYRTPHLVEELNLQKYLNLPVEISVDEGITRYKIHKIEQRDRFGILIYSPNV